MKIFLLFIILGTTFTTAEGQKRFCAKLHLVYPQKLVYDTLLIKDSKGNLVTPVATSTIKDEVTDIYMLGVDSALQGDFSIYFGGSSSAVNDSLYFLSYGKDLVIRLQDSFALGNRIYFKLKNVYNFEDLYERYTQYYLAQLQTYDSLIKNNPGRQFSEDQYLLKAGFDFVKENLSNPYSIDLFSVFVINSPVSPVDYMQANEFYIKNLKNEIKDPKKRIWVEKKMEKLKQSLNEGVKAPVFSVRSLDGELIDNSSLAGKNVLITFWATWCAPCMKELPYLKLIHEEYKKDNLIMVSVSLDGDSLKMAKVIKEENLNWTQIYNSKSILEAFRINPIPAMFLIDEKGVILYNSLSEKNIKDPLQGLTSLLKQKFNH